MEGQLQQLPPPRPTAASSDAEERQPQLRQMNLFSALPAQSLTRALPHGVPADILLLSNDATAGAGQDMRSLLFTCYAERGLPSRGKIRVTSSHESKEVVGRDVLILSLLLDGDVADDGEGKWDRLWEMYHSLFVDEEVMEMVGKQAEKLLQVSSNGLEAWRGSEYGAVVDFAHEQALQEIRQVWEQYQQTTSTTARDKHDEQRKMLMASILESKQMRGASSADFDRELSISGLRSCAPIPVAGREIVSRGYKKFWDDGAPGRQVTGGGEGELGEPVEAPRRVANPLLTTCLDPISDGPRRETAAKLLHYASNPLLGYHLGTALARLAPESPYSVKSGEPANTDQCDGLLAAIKVQFREWARAFVDMARKDCISMRYALGEPIAILEGMTSSLNTSTTETDLVHFDVIDTSTLADELGILDLLVAARRLLKPSPMSILYTECLRRTPGMTYKQRLEELMHGDIVANSLFLGMSPIEYWSNTSLESCIDDVLIEASYDELPSELLQNHFKSSWRLMGAFSMDGTGVMAVPRISMEVDDVVVVLLAAFDSWAKLDVSCISILPPKSGERSFKRLTAFAETCRQHIQTDWKKVHVDFLDNLKGSDQGPPHKDILEAEFDKLHLSNVSLAADQNMTAAENAASMATKLSFEKTRLASLAIRIEIVSESAKAALQDGALVRIHQTTPYAIGVMVGDYVLSEKAIFPIPILVSKTTTRIARDSGYIEVVAQVVDPIELEEHSELIFPAKFCEMKDESGAFIQMPVSLNNHSVNLDSLPVISVDNESEEAKKANSWLGTLTSQQFSKRERKERELAHEDDTVATSTRLNLKEAIFTMFMLASGLQGGSTGLFALSHPIKGNQMLIFVRALRLDASVGSVVADAAVLPITRELLDTGELETFLLVLRELDACVIDVTDEELVLWKQILPEFVERCRTWEHMADCAYSKSGRVPSSKEAEAPFLCGCGNGELPDQYMGGLPEWNTAAQHAVRIAICPLFAVPWVEDIMDVEMVRSAGGIDGMDSVRDRCRSCGAFTREGNSGDGHMPLLRCTRCRSAMYCSQACQKKDWKKHRAECQPPS